MTMAGSKSSPSSMSARDIGDTGSPSSVSGSIRAASPTSIKAVLLPDGWHDVQNCQLIQFAFGEAHSPITPPKLYPYLTYTEEGREVYTPMGQVLGFDLTDAQQHISHRQGQSQQ